LSYSAVLFLWILSLLGSRGSLLLKDPVWEAYVLPFMAEASGRSQWVHLSPVPQGIYSSSGPPSSGSSSGGSFGGPYGREKELLASKLEFLPPSGALRGKGRGEDESLGTIGQRTNNYSEQQAMDQSHHHHPAGTTRSPHRKKSIFLAGSQTDHRAHGVL